ncbi:hypothetical protein D515_01241 [Grimontia indica]|uniref:Lipoprotein n=1 Tax=Grimontia indica TaxID=1056512 RepID=R1GU99_9GAMM|nr:hypothetical protein D515_01241 [Grimontia indica]
MKFGWLMLTSLALIACSTQPNFSSKAKYQVGKFYSSST